MMTTTTTPRNTTLRSAARRLLSISAAATIAAVGLVALSAPAHAAPATSKVWVCKYVRTPGGNEVLKSGKNPIEVSGNSVDKDKNGQIFVGDEFADAQELSVVVQIGGEDPGEEICSPTSSPTSSPAPSPTTPPKPGGGKPGDGAPHTGGEGDDVPVGLVGGGALLVGAALVAAEAERRRRAATHR
jgi:hypothetical protein